MKKTTLAFALLLGAQLSMAQNSCATATTLNLTALQTTINSNSTPPQNICFGTGTTSGARWYKYIANENISVTLTTDLSYNQDKDTRFQVYTGTCNNLVCYSGDDNSGVLGSGLLATATFTVTQGTTYYIAFENPDPTHNSYYFRFYKENYTATPVVFRQQTISANHDVSCVVDMDGDYLDDIVVYNGGISIMKQLPEGGFSSTQHNFSGGLATQPGWSIAAGDYDKNGYTDLVFGGQNLLTVIKANNDGTQYSEVRYPQSIFTQRTNFIDINNDGHLDLFACHDVAQSHSYKNDGAGNLVFDPSFFPTLAVGGNYASIWTDYDNDGDMDMYLAKCRGGAPVGDPQRINLLYRNNGNGTFTEVGAAARVNDGAQSWSTAVEDFDNDGDMDFLLSNISDSNRLYRNNGDGTFTDVYAASGIASQVGSWEVQTGDFNNDGFIDFIWSNGKQLYLNNGNLTFTGYNLIFSQGGIGDLNNDGFLDIQMMDKIYFNTPNGNNWAKVNLKGILSNSNGIGARVELYGSWGKQIREIRSGHGFAHQSSLNAYFGIGTATSIDKIVVKWPSGVVDTIENPSINQATLVVEESTLGIAESQNSFFSVFPNPAKDIVNIKLKQIASEIKDIQIYDINGRIALQPTLKENTISVQTLSAGTYVIVIKNSEGKKYSQKFIKE